MILHPIHRKAIAIFYLRLFILMLNKINGCHGMNSRICTSTIPFRFHPNADDVFFSSSSSPPAASFPMPSSSNYFDQQSSTTTVEAAFDNDTVKAAQNILSLLQESQFAADTEVTTTTLSDIHRHFPFSVQILCGTCSWRTDRLVSRRCQEATGYRRSKSMD